MRLAGMMLALALVMPAIGQAADAQTAPVRLYVDGQAAFVQSGEGARVAAAFTPKAAALSAKEAQYRTFSDTFQRDLVTLNETQLIKRRREIGDLRAAVMRERNILNEDMVTAQSTARSTFMDKMDRALKDYLAQNPDVALIEYIDTQDENGPVVIRSQVYDITTNLFEMTKAGPGAFANAAPKTAARTLYVDLGAYLIASGVSQKVIAERNAYLDRRTAEGRSLKDRLDAFYASSASYSQADYTARIQPLFTQQQAFDNETQNEMKAITDFGISKARMELVALLKSNPVAANADVIQFYDSRDGKPGGVRVADRKLDITAQTAAAYKAAKGQ